MDSYEACEVTLSDLAYKEWIVLNTDKVKESVGNLLLSLRVTSHTLEIAEMIGDDSLDV